jgi:hypothetical protein
MKKVFTIFLLFATLIIQAQTTYYIDPAGNNANPGTISSPWLTLTYACAHAITLGDIIHVNQGTYNETSQSVLRVGVSIVGEGNTSIIKSKVTTLNDFTILMSSPAEGTNGNQSISYIRMEGGMTAYGAIYVAARSNVEIHYCEFEDFFDYGVIFSGQLLRTDGEPKIYANGNKFHDNKVTNCADYNGAGKFGDGLGNLGLGGQQDMLIYNNTMIQKDRGKDANGYVIKFVNDGFIKGVKIYDNTIIKPPYDNSTWDFAIELWHYRGGVEIYNNNIQGSIDIGGNAYGGKSISANDAGGYGFAIKIHDNIIGQSTMNVYEESGINPERGITGGVYIYNNWFNNMSTPLQMYQGNGDTFEDLWVYNNIFTNIGIVGGEPGNTTDWGTIDGNTITYHDIYFLNNTIYAGAEGVAANSGLRFDFPGPCTDLYVRNNIIEGFNVFAIYFGGKPIERASVENNIFYNNASNTADSGGTTITSKTEKNNRIVNPSFVSSSDFHLQGTSPAIGAGIDVGLVTDKDGVVWNKPPSIGAYEYPRIIENKPPSIQDQGFQLNENSPDGTVVGSMVASDPDEGQILTYSIISGNTNGAFAIDALTGILSVVNGAALTVDFSLVVKVQDNGVSELSSQATIAINIIPVGIKFTEKNQVIKVYPNPVSDKLIIEIEGNKNNPGVEILNSIGQVVFEGNLSEKTIVQTSNFSPGIYLIKIENCGSFEFKKILKI